MTWVSDWRISRSFRFDPACHLIEIHVKPYVVHIDSNDATATEMLRAWSLQHAAGARPVVVPRYILTGWSFSVRTLWRSTIRRGRTWLIYDYTSTYLTCPMLIVMNASDTTRWGADQQVRGDRAHTRIGPLSSSLIQLHLLILSCHWKGNMRHTDVLCSPKFLLQLFARADSGC